MIVPPLFPKWLLSLSLSQNILGGSESEMKRVAKPWHGMASHGMAWLSLLYIHQDDIIQYST